MKQCVLFTLDKRKLYILSFIGLLLLGWNIYIYTAGAVEYSKTSHTNEWPRYDTKQSDAGVPVEELWRMRNTPSLSLLLDPLWPVKVLAIGHLKPCKWPPLILSRKERVLLRPDVNKQPY